MSRSVMDREGFRRKGDPNCTKKLRRAERWIRELLKEGMTVSEAHWELHCIFSATMENVRGDLVRKGKRR